MARNKPLPVDSAKTKILKNGAIYDLEKKKIVGLRPELAEKNTQITKANSSEMQARRHERKRNIIAAAAAEAVERDDYRLAYGGDAWIAAIAQTQYIKATTPDDPKSTDAARFLLQETGLSEKQQAEASDKPQSATDTAIVALINAMTQAITQRTAQVVDGSATPADDDEGEGVEGGGG